MTRQELMEAIEDLADKAQRDNYLSAAVVLFALIGAIKVNQEVALEHHVMPLVYDMLKRLKSPE